MSPRRRILLLILIMAVIVLAVEFMAISMLYRTALDEQKSRLQETVVSQARLIESIFRFNSIYLKNYPAGAKEATIRQVVSAHKQYHEFGRTGEVVLAKKEKDNIVFILQHNHGAIEIPASIPFDSKLAQPARLALLGLSGTIIALDYRGIKVLAAYEPVGELHWAVVAKIDMKEMRAPFIKAGIICTVIGIIAILLGTIIFYKVTEPLIRNLHDTVAELKKALAEVSQLSGLLPICSYCKKIRDDNGYWNQLEAYLQKHTEAEFSHGICPDCERKLRSEMEQRKSQ
ncbi:MAG: hypothetical protein A2W27_03925 [Deltaproteobacteria bacterium RBG_16_44_11]|nr:MAG: hypothetical protein A2W27_03925 [Deltaproteobacteria bacterium RBG_16_44_11]